MMKAFLRKIRSCEPVKIETRAGAMFRMICLLLCLLACSTKAYAYLDPGTGSYLFQMILATFIAVFFGVKLYFNKIKHFFKKFLSSEKNEP